MADICTNDPAAKAAAVYRLIDAQSERRSELEELLSLGKIHHDYDVSYAVIMLDRGHSLTQVASDLDEGYFEHTSRGTVCDPVPPRPKN